MTIRIILKSGNEFYVKCENVIISRNGLNRITNLKFENVTENQILEIDFNDISAIVRVVSDEQEEYESDDSLKED